MSAKALLGLWCWLFFSYCCHAADAATPIATTIVDFDSHGARLSATITLPSRPRAAVVVVNGSGREAQLLSMANYMAANGIAVLTYDKRGTGKSGGVYAGPEVGTNNVTPGNLELLASDARMALDTLRRQPAVRDVPAGFFGFSQAGWIIPLAAMNDRAARFVVIVSGPVVTTREQMRFQFLTGGKSTFWETHSEAEAREHIRNDPDPFPFEDTDPLDSIATLSIPGLWLHGSNDVLVPVSLSRERLAELSRKGKPFESRLYDGGDHALLMSKPEALDAAIAWIIDMTRKPEHESVHPR